jgi:hypothetical protein
MQWRFYAESQEFSLREERSEHAREFRESMPLLSSRGARSWHRPRMRIFWQSVTAKARGPWKARIPGSADEVPVLNDDLAWKRPRRLCLTFPHCGAAEGRAAGSYQRTIASFASDVVLRLGRRGSSSPGSGSIEEERSEAEALRVGSF